MSESLFVMLLLASITIHELGHAWLFMRYKIPLEEICVLGIGPKIFSFNWKKQFEDTPITVRLFPLGAFIKRKKNGKKLPWEKQVHVLSGGIAMNFKFTALLLFLSEIVKQEAIPSLFAGPIVISALLLAIGIVMWNMPRTSGYIVLIFGILSLLLLGYSISVLPFTEAIGGPVSVAAEVEKAASVTKALRNAGLISLGIGLVNSLPFFPLDGGQIFLISMQRYFPNRTELQQILAHKISLAGFALLIVSALGSDIVKLSQ